MAETLEHNEVDTQSLMPDEVVIRAPLPLHGITTEQLRMRMKIEGMLPLFTGMQKAGKAIDEQREQH